MPSLSVGSQALAPQTVGQDYPGAMEGLARLILALAAGLALLGLALLLASKLGLGRLPGDVVVRRGNLSLYLPIGLMVLLSLVLTIVLNLLLRR
jgi:hypothetical protein